MAEGLACSREIKGSGKDGSLSMSQSSLFGTSVVYTYAKPPLTRAVIAYKRGPRQAKTVRLLPFGLAYSTKGVSNFMSIAHESVSFRRIWDVILGTAQRWQAQGRPKTIQVYELTRSCR